jgi:hypothetical protein
MIKWVEGLHSGKVLSPASYKEFITPSKLNDGTPLRYSMGIGVGQDANGQNYIGHGGAIGGFLAEAGWYPDQQMAVVVLMNSNGQQDPGEVVTGARARGDGRNAAGREDVYRRQGAVRRQVHRPFARPRHDHHRHRGSDGLSFAGDDRSPSGALARGVDLQSGDPGLHLPTDRGQRTVYRASGQRGAGYYILKRQ